MSQTETATLSPFFAREDELATIAARLADPACRLLTLVGLGGVGKTRLAFEAGKRQAGAFADGVVLLELQAGIDLPQIAAATADALRITVHEQSEPGDQILRWLRDRRILLIVDGAETGPVVEWVHAILSAAPGVKVLATAREPLLSQFEWLLTVTGLPYPNAGDSRVVLDPGAFGAVALFGAAARRQRSGFSLSGELGGVLRICRLVEGHPLALELAANWALTLSSDEIADLIERDPRRLAAPFVSLPARQRRLQTVLDETWARLSAAERRALGYLSTFRGGAALWAIGALGDDPLEILHALTARALVNRTASGRFDLHALVRGYVLSRLQESPTTIHAAQDAHAAVMLRRLVELAPALQDARQASTLSALVAERDNLRAAWARAAETRAVDLLAAALEPLWFFVDVHAWYREGERFFNEALKAIDAPALPRDEAILRARLLARLGSMAYSLNQPETSAAQLEESLAQLTALGAEQEQAFSWQKLGETGYRLGRPDYEDSLRRGLALYERAGDTFGIAGALVWLAYGALQRCDMDEARAMAHRSLELYRILGAPLGLMLSHQALAAVEAAGGDADAARRYAEQTLRLADSFGSPWSKAMARSDFAGILIPAGEQRQAVQLIRESLVISLEHGLIPFVMMALLELAQFYRSVGRMDRAIEWLALISYHPMGWDTADVACEILDEVAPNPETGPYADAVARGRQADLTLKVEGLLADWDREVMGALARPALETLPLSGEHLTAREAEILRRLAAGDSNRDIASGLVVTLGTVKWYVNQIYSKLGVRSRTQAVARARELGLLS